MLFHRLFVFADTEKVSTFLLGHLLLVSGSRDSHDCVSKRFCDFDTHSSKSTDTNDTDSDFFIILWSKMFKWAVHGDTSAKNRRRKGEVHTIWNLDDIIFMDYVRAGIATIGLRVWVTRDSSMLSIAIVGSSQTIHAILLIAIFAHVAVTARVDKASNSTSFTNFELGYFWSDFNNSTQKLMPWKHWEFGATPFIGSLMSVSMADTTKEHFELDVIITNCSSWELDRRNFFTLVHDAPSSFHILTIDWFENVCRCFFHIEF